jgi:hypothetical protein
VRSNRAMLPLLYALLAVGLVAEAPAELYKWVDERGVVNYTDKPPPGRNARALPETSGSLSVVPGLSSNELERQRDRADDLRVQRLERELAELRGRERSREPSVPQGVYNETYVPAYGYVGSDYGRPGGRRRGAYYEPPPPPNPPLQFERPRERPAYTRR